MPFNSLFNSKLFSMLVIQTLKKFSPLKLWHNPVIFTVEICALVATILTFSHFENQNNFWLNFNLSSWLWIMILFSNVVESLAEVKGMRQAERLKEGRSNIYAQRLTLAGNKEEIEASLLKPGDIISLSDGMLVPSDGKIIEGAALVDESVITGESAPVVRSAEGGKTRVIGGTLVISGEIKVEIKAEMGKSFVDGMIRIISGSRRYSTPNERMLELLLISSSVVFFAVVFNLTVFSRELHYRFSWVTLIALFVSLLPTTIGGLLPAVYVVGMDHLLTKNVIALSGKAIEAAADVDVVLIDKTGTITLGNRLATNFYPVNSVSERQLARYAMLASLADDTPEGRSIVVLAKNKLGLRGRDIRLPSQGRFIEFSPETSISGIDLRGQKIRKGSIEAMELFSKDKKNLEIVKSWGKRISEEGGTPLLVADQEQIFGLVYLKDILKKGIKERLLKLKNMGISSIMVTGDNPSTAAAIAAEAGISDFIARATPDVKLKRIKELQSEGYLVAMIGDGINDAPALAQADVGVAMNVGTQSAKEAANLIDLDSSPAKLLDIIAIGKQTGLTRGAITTFSILNDLLKYLVILPTILAPQYPFFKGLNLIHLHAPDYVILTILIFSSLSIPLLMPWVLYGVKVDHLSIKGLLRKNLWFFGIGGGILSIIGLKLIDYYCFGWF